MSKKRRDKGAGKSSSQKDPVTGKSIVVSGVAKLNDDIIYKVTENSPDTPLDDVITPLASSPPAITEAGTFYVQCQLTPRALALDIVLFDADTGSNAFKRSILFGEFSFNKKNEFLKGSISSGANMYLKSDGWGYADVDILTNPQSSGANPFDYSPQGITAKVSTSIEDLPDGSRQPLLLEEGSGMDGVISYGGGRFFYNGWQNEIFNASLL